MTTRAYLGDWGPLAQRGELGMTLLTALAAARVGLPIGAGVRYLGIIDPDDGTSFALGFISFEDLEEFVSELMPRNVLVQVGPGEDAAPIEAMIARGQGAMLH